MSTLQGGATSNRHITAKPPSPGAASSRQSGAKQKRHNQAGDSPEAKAVKVLARTHKSLQYTILVLSGCSCSPTSAIRASSAARTSLACVIE